MTKTHWIVLGACAVALAVPTYIETRKIQRLEADVKRKEFLTNMVKEAHAIGVAEQRVIERLHRGEYTGKTFQDVLNDLKFETIVETNKDE